MSVRIDPNKVMWMHLWCFPIFHRYMYRNEHERIFHIIVTTSSKMGKEARAVQLLSDSLDTDDNTRPGAIIRPPNIRQLNIPYGNS